MRRLIDANVILRYLFGDIPAQAETARQAIESGAFMTEAVLAEVVYVLRDVYSVPKPQLSELLGEFLSEVECENRAVLDQALKLYGIKSKLDFVDCLLIAHHTVDNDIVITFDKAMNRELSNPSI